MNEALDNLGLGISLSPTFYASFLAAENQNQDMLSQQTTLPRPATENETAWVATELELPSSFPGSGVAEFFNQSLATDQDFALEGAEDPSFSSVALVRGTGAGMGGLSPSPLDCWTLSGPSPALSPVDLWSSSNYALLWDYFVVQGSKMFLCFDPEALGSQSSIKDPCSSALVSMAVSSPPLRLAVLALSAFLYGMECKKPESTAEASRLGKQASRALCAARSDPIRRCGPLETAATGLLVFLLNDVQSMEMLSLGREAVASLLQSRSFGVAHEDEYQVDVILHLYRWAEICILLSLHNSRPLGRTPSSLIEFQDRELNSSFIRQFKSCVIHPLYTFSYRWINPLLRLGRLTRMRRDAASSNPPVESSPAIETLDDEIDEMEETVLNARHLDLIAFKTQSQDQIDLLHLNEAMYSAFFLLFYTRLRDMLWTEQIIRRQVRNICDQVSAINERSQVLNNVAFPLYIGGCEAVDTELRVRIEYLISRQHYTGYWMGQNMRLIRSLRSIWELRDRQPGITWVQWINRGIQPGIRMVYQD